MLIQVGPVEMEGGKERKNVKHVHLKFPCWPWEKELRRSQKARSLNRREVGHKEKSAVSAGSTSQAPPSFPTHRGPGSPCHWGTLWWLPLLPPRFPSSSSRHIESAPMSGIFCSVYDRFSTLETVVIWLSVLRKGLWPRKHQAQWSSLPTVLRWWELWVIPFQISPCGWQSYRTYSVQILKNRWIAEEEM